jgi:hypothetical protein
MVDVLERDIGTDRGLVITAANRAGVALGQADVAIVDVLKVQVKDRYLETAFLLGSDRTRCWKLIEDVENSYIKGQDEYPTTPTGAYNLLINWKHDPRNGSRGPNTNEVVSFNTNGTEEPEKFEASDTFAQTGKRPRTETR